MNGMTRLPLRASYTKLPGRPALAGTPALRLVCFGFAGGSITALLPWLSHLPAGIEPWLAEYPGRGLRMDETACGTDAALLADLAPGLAELASQPFALLGYSMGGAVASHLASRLLATLGVRPAAFVAVSARGGHHNEDIVSLADADDDALLKRMLALGGIPAAILHVPEILQPFLSSLRSDLACCRDLARAGAPRLPCPVLLLRGERDPLLAADDEASWMARSAEPGQSQVLRLDAGHFLHHGRERALAQSLADWLLRQHHLALPSAPIHGAALPTTLSLAGSTS